MYPAKETARETFATSFHKSFASRFLSGLISAVPNLKNPRDANSMQFPKCDYAAIRALIGRHSACANRLAVQRLSAAATSALCGIEGCAPDFVQARLPAAAASSSASFRSGPRRARRRDSRRTYPRRRPCPSHPPAGPRRARAFHRRRRARHPCRGSRSSWFAFSPASAASCSSRLPAFSPSASAMSAASVSFTMRCVANSISPRASARNGAKFNRTSAPPARARRAAASIAWTGTSS